MHLSGCGVTPPSPTHLIPGNVGKPVGNLGKPLGNAAKLRTQVKRIRREKGRVRFKVGRLYFPTSPTSAGGDAGYPDGSQKGPDKKSQPEIRVRSGEGGLATHPLACGLSFVFLHHSKAPHKPCLCSTERAHVQELKAQGEPPAHQLAARTLNFEDRGRDGRERSSTASGSGAPLCAPKKTRNYETYSRVGKVLFLAQPLAHEAQPGCSRTACVC